MSKWDLIKSVIGGIFKWLLPNLKQMIRMIRQRKWKLAFKALLPYVRTFIEECKLLKSHYDNLKNDCDYFGNRPESDCEDK